MPSTRGQNIKKSTGGTHFKKRAGFSLIEIVVVIAIMAIIAALLVPALIHYTEDSRAQKDVTTMDEVVNAVQLALADPDCYDEMRTYAFDNNFITYSDSSGSYASQFIDAEYWAPDGAGRAVTITFNPEKAKNGDTIYRLENAIINDMTYGNGSVANNRNVDGAQIDDISCYFKDAKLSSNQQSGYTYNRVRQVIGTHIVCTSATYSNSSFTIFIKFLSNNNEPGNTTTSVYGSFNGTNLYEGAPASKGTGTVQYDNVSAPGTFKPIQNNNGGTTSSNISSSALQGTGSSGGSYKQETDNIVNTMGVLSKTKLATVVETHGITKLIFTDRGLSEGEDVSENGNQTVLAKVEGTVCTISTNKTNRRIQVPNNCSNFFSTQASTQYAYITDCDVSGLSMGNVQNATNMFGYLGSKVNEQVSITGLEYWKTSSFTSMDSMFAGVGQKAQTVNLTDISAWDTSKVNNMQLVFDSFAQNSATINTIDLSNWNVCRVNTLGGMFKNASTKTSTFNFKGMDKWDVSNVKRFRSLFFAAGQNSTVWNFDFSRWDMSSAEVVEYMFYGTGQKAQNWSVGNLSGWDISNVKSLYGMFTNAAINTQEFNIGNIGKWDTSKVTNFKGMFSGTASGSNLKSFYIGDVSSWDMSSALTIEQIFERAGINANSVNIGDLSKWDVANVTNMANAFNASFANSTSLYLGDMSNWNTGNVTDMTAMFAGFGQGFQYQMDLSAWNVSNVVSHDDFFNYFTSPNMISPQWES